MEHFVGYHSVEKMGGHFTAVRKGARDSFYTRKHYKRETVEGNWLWVIEGSGSPRRYKLVSFGTVNVFSPVRDKEQLHRVVFKPHSDVRRIDVTNLSWFKRLLKEQQSFRFGLNKIRNRRVIGALERLTKRRAKGGRNLAIKALTIRQPWAELILRKRKPFELRTWRTNYRGPLAIHAASQVDVQGARDFGLRCENLATSAFVGFAILSDVRPYTREDARLLKKRRAGYGWSPRNLSWVLKQPRRITPVSANGQLGLFDAPKSVERRVKRLLGT